MNASFSSLIAYFENIAKKHKNIMHTEDRRSFFRMEVDEVLAGINRSDCGYPMLIMEGYGANFTNPNSDNILKQRHGGFILLDKISDIHDFTAKHNTWDQLEVIGDDILIKMLNDKQNRNTPIIRAFDISSVDASLISNEIGKTVGIRYLFTIDSPISSNVDNTKWNE